MAASFLAASTEIASSGRGAMTVKIGETETEKNILFNTDSAWLDQVHEEIIDPDMPIIDPHHHLWDRGARYLLHELLADTGSGHNIRSTVYLQCDSMYRAGGDPNFAPVGETEFVNGIGAMAASGTYGETLACAGMVGFANLTMGSHVEAVLEAHVRAAPERFKGVRHCAVWDEDRSIKTTPMDFPRGLLLDPKFREGYACLARFGLSYESWIYHPQIPEFTDLARAFPDTPVILDHIGGRLGIGAYAGKEKEVFAVWRKNIEELARCPNAFVKIGGMGMHISGFDFEKKKLPPTSDELVAAWKPYVEVCIEAFGPGRAMFESNFPVDKRYHSYPVLWNAFKKLARDYSPDEKALLFRKTAARVYGLPLN
jgi:predicted TIM-barrel fold metal-dependent hydrolase